MHGFWGAVDNNFDVADVGFLPGQRSSGNLRTSDADFSAEEHIFLANLALGHPEHLLTLVGLNVQTKL